MPWSGYHQYLIDHIRSHRSRRLLEIGVYDGDNAVNMVRAAAEDSGPSIVEYYGFDYFEEFSEQEVARKLAATGCSYHLYRGDTLETLPRATGLPDMDLVFIDGGKSEQEAFSDWTHSSKLLYEGSVVFVHNADFYGVKRMVESIPRDRYDVTVFHESYQGLVAKIELRVRSAR